jgi:hypothetical protein
LESGNLLVELQVLLVLPLEILRQFIVSFRLRLDKA